MVAYARDEMVGITELSKSLGKYLDKVIATQKVSDTADTVLRRTPF